jgi:uroporphyrinogen decarboxylase
MTNRENFFHLIAGGSPERVPFTLDMCDSLKQQFEIKYGADDYHAYYDVPFANIGIRPSRNPIDYSGYFSPGEIDFYDDWGVGYKHGSMHHFTRFISPMKNFDSPEQVWDFPMEDYLADYRWEGLAEKVTYLKSRDKIVKASSPSKSIFEATWYLRGLDNLLCDFILNPEMARACLDRTMQLRRESVARHAYIGADILVFGDDIGTERGMMMSPDIWREWLKPRLTELISIAKSINPNVLCYYHSDGDIRPVIDELLDCGVDILNPIQPECMDPAEIYHKYKHRASFWGAIGTQTTMPFGTVEDVRSKTRELLELCRHEGRLILAPTHLLEPEVPLENVDAFVETVKNFRP